MIRRGSRYQGLQITGVASASGLKPVMQRRVPVNRDDLGNDYVEHAAVAGERLDQICALYGIPQRMWWVLADVNGIELPWEIAEGTTIIVPSTRFVALL